LGFDTAYAMPDRDDDLRIGINSSAIFFGKYVAEAIAIFFVGTAALLAYVAVVMQLNPSFWLAWGMAVIGWIWQYIRLRQKDLPKPIYGQIFRQNVWLGFILLAGMVVGCLLK
jgi:4-hydroxybenzoate polyprenyltransferase